MPPQLTEEQRIRYRDLFEKLDSNSDGKIDVNDLVVHFERSGLSSCQDNHITRAKKFFLRGDKSASGTLTFNEFAHYMKDHERRLELVFQGMDTNKDNKIGTSELIGYFRQLGIDIQENEAKHLLKKINRNGSLTIEPNEWKTFFLLTPIDTIQDLLYHWQHSTLIDIGETLTLPEIPKEDKRANMWWKNFVSGAVAGAISRTCTAPLDRIKTVMQVLGSRKKITITSGFQHMLKEGGITSLWRGNGINILKIAPEAALKFMFYEEIKALLIRDQRRGPTYGERFVAGSLAGALAQSVIYPLEVLKTRLVLRKTGEYNNVFDCVRKIVRREGPTAFYKGFLPNILGIIPYAGTDLAVYETLKHFHMDRHGVESPALPVLLLCGSISTISGQLVSYPLSLVRTRLQAQELPVHAANQETMTTIIKNIWKNEGIRGMYRGIMPNILKVVPAVSISYAVYENMKKALIEPKLKN